MAHVMKSDAATNGTRCFRVSESKVSCSVQQREHDMCRCVSGVSDTLDAFLLFVSYTYVGTYVRTCAH